MLKNLRLKSNAMLAAFVLSFLIFASNGAYAQYCEFTGGSWNELAPRITEVLVDEVTTGNAFVKAISYKGITGYDQYKNWGENYVPGAEGVQLGKRYQVTVRGLTNSSGYSGYVRVFMDLNANGKWSDAGEYLGAISVGVGPLNTSNFTYGVVGWSYGGWYFNVPCNAPLSKTRLRVISGYNYLGGTPLSEPCVISYYDSPSYTFGKSFYGEVEDHELTILPDAPKSIPTDVAVFNASNVKVEDFTLLLANTNYSQVWAGNATATPTPKPSLQFGSNTAGTIVQMRIEGPLPSTTVVWEARNGLNTSNTITMGSNGDNFSAQYTDSDGKAKYTFAPTKSSGAYSPNGDGAFYGTSGGEYKLVITVAGTGCPGAANRLFTVAYPNDVAVATITSPLNNDFPKYAKYGVGQTVKLEAVFQNVGLNPVTEFWAYYTIKDATGKVIYYDSTYWDTTGSNGTILAMKSGEKIPLLLGYKKFNAPALYTMEVTVSRATGLDDELFNSSFPRPGSPVYVFEVAYDIELSASQIFAPASGDLLIAGRQYRASAEFKNNGISLASKVPVSMVIINNITNTVELTLDAEISDIQYGRYNTKTVNFGTFAISKPGSYRAKISVRASEDIVYGNDTMSIYFTVESGIMGTYTVGTLKETAAGFTADRNFSTLQELSNALFYNGISGSVVFELTDAVYNASTTVTNSAAWDLSSRILGLGYDAENKVYNTITFKPSLNREGIRGGVQINLSSTSGVGVRLGQSNNATSNNEFALFRTFGTQANANNAGYISFLGGAQKSIKFVNINTSATPTHNSAIYMNAGARNITVKNCIIENGTPATFKLTRLPGAEYSATGERIRFEEDYPNQSPTPTGVNSATYSAGIVLRAVTGVSSTITTVAQDTIASNSNIIEGNEISNFGVGILSLGYGPLKLAGPNTFKEFYNFNNTFANNQIYNVARAGIFLGYERNTSVKNNRIWNVGNSPMFASDAAGIQLGGNNLPVIAGYNNYEISIDGNQISDVTSTTNAIGILNEQTRRTYGLGLKTVNFPATENTKIANNIVWNLGTNNNTAASRIGIASMTSVLNNNIMTPLNPGYHTNGEMIANNTIIIGDANTTAGNLVGIASIKNDNSSIYNNAISIIAPGFTATNNTVGAAIYYNGLSLRNNAGLKSDRNIFFTGNTDSKSSNVDVFRITEVNAADVITVAGANAEYRTLEQVQAWFGTNENSLYGNFASDLALNNANPPMYTVNPNLSKGSLLNNRGVNLSWVANDNSGVKRGNGGERYDIGAFEFTSPLYNEDVEVTNANGPRAYQSLSAPFNDAQYIMTTAPTTVNAIVRNNGRLPQSAYKMTVNIYRETPAGTFETTPKATATTTIALGSSESMNVNFPGFTFTPETYAQLSANVPPYNTGMFTAMSANVTPRYMIIFSGSSDELNTNNNDTIIVRYYIKKSTLSVIASGVQQSTNEFNVSTPANDMMARLNAKALEEGFSKMGWRISATENHYDRFERNAWEPRAVNYTNYLTLFWADGNNETPTANQVRDINAFLDNSKEMPKYKRNLVLASQEIVANTKATDNTFRTEVLRADLDPMYGATAGNNTPFFGRTSTPLPGTQYFGRNITGVNVARDFSMVVNMPLNINNNSVTFTNDLASFPAVLVGLNNSTLQGLTKDAFVYTDASVTGKPVMGVATTSIDRNVITLGMDWRHFGDMDLMMKGIVDYIAKNTDVVPVELVDFKATKVGQKVVLDWATASENNTSKFEVEKAVVSQTGSQDFNKVAELAAAGNSKDVKFYGPVTDYDVVPNTTYAYKLRMVDRTGEFSYSDTRLVVMNAENGIITLGDAQPNPASNSTKVAFTLSQPNAVTVTMYDVNGNAVESVSNFYTTGTHFFTPDLSKIASGSYTVVLKSGEVVLTKSLNVVK